MVGSVDKIDETDRIDQYTSHPVPLPVPLPLTPPLPRNGDEELGESRFMSQVAHPLLPTASRFGGDGGLKLEAVLSHLEPPASHVRRFTFHVLMCFSLTGNALPFIPSPSMGGRGKGEGGNRGEKFRESRCRLPFHRFSLHA